MNFEQRFYEKEFKLNDTDSSIVEYILEHRSEIDKLAIQKIASDLFISPNAVMRLSKKLGYSGFSELKFALHNEETKQLENTSNMTVAGKVMEKIPGNIVRTRDLRDEELMEKMVKDMKQANKILFVGTGDSAYFAEQFGRYLRCLDKHVEYFPQINDMEYMARQYGAGDMVVVLSASGRVERLVNIAKRAKAQGSLVYCMTHFGENPLSKVCDEQLCFWGEKRVVNGYNVTDYIGLMMLIRLICEEYWKELCV